MIPSSLWRICCFVLQVDFKFIMAKAQSATPMAGLSYSLFVLEEISNILSPGSNAESHSSSIFYMLLHLKKMLSLSLSVKFLISGITCIATVFFHLGHGLRTFRKPLSFLSKGMSQKTGYSEATWGRVPSCILKQQQVCTYNDLDFCFLSCKILK